MTGATGAPLSAAAGAGVRADLPSAIVRFAAVLRRHGLPVALLQVTDAVRALEQLDLADRDEVRLGLRVVLVSRPEDLPTFDRCFDEFWRPDVAEDTLDFPGMVSPAPTRRKAWPCRWAVTSVRPSRST